MNPDVKVHHVKQMHHPGAVGGYYIKEDIREIVRYATELHIDVIPESIHHQSGRASPQTRKGA